MLQGSQPCFQSCFQHWSESQYMLALEFRQNSKNLPMGVKILRLTFRPGSSAGEDWVDYGKRLARVIRANLTKMELPTTGEK